MKSAELMGISDYKCAHLHFLFTFTCVRAIMRLHVNIYIHLYPYTPAHEHTYRPICGVSLSPIFLIYHA